MIDIKEVLEDPYKNYIYSYPHKMSYSKFDTKINLKDLWNDDISNLTLYIHIPFCANKCGYCNLFSTSDINKDLLDRYSDKLIEEIKAIKEIMGLKLKNNNLFSNIVFGGGTPTILSKDNLKKILEGLKLYLNINFSKSKLSIETSPKTLNKSKLELLKEYNLYRISIGIQSFNENELININRLEPLDKIDKALDLLKNNKIKIRNLDLIYGIENQSLKSFEYNLKKAVYYNFEEIYLYPLYIREETYLYDKTKKDIDKMKRFYEFACEFLIKNNYIQTSMRNFINKNVKKELYPNYSCQENNMIGIGCGARSYKDNIHYSRKYARLDKNIKNIINDYLQEVDFLHAKHGFNLNIDESKRRYIQKSILKITGLNLDDFKNKFNCNPFEYKELEFLLLNQFLIKEGKNLIPTKKGLAYSDSIGNLFISETVKNKMLNFKE
ncbi:STM4012 family radical SAM protein [Peptostreptococcaceae bacterium AGR-M142]